MADTKSLNLSRAYTYAGKTYGPGPAEVPADAVESLNDREAAFKKRLDDGYEPPAPITPSVNAGNLIDPRKRPAIDPSIVAVVEPAQKAKK